jgi:type II secretory pathway predicted ATPase ExeA
MSYLQFFGLTHEPFANTPISGKFYYNSFQHSQAVLRLMYVAQQMRGLGVLVGDIGTGKTTLARKMLENLPESEYEAALLVIIHSGITANWLLKRIALQLGIENPADEKLQLLSQLYRRLLKIAESGRKAVVLIDEAQMLNTREIMEEFRGLLNLEVPNRKLISFIFFGLPELEQVMKLDPPLEQRIALKCFLRGFDEKAVNEYITHRLSLSGAPDNIFPDDVISLIHRYTKGIPRLINTVCDNALFEAHLMNSKVINKTIIENVAHSFGLLGQNNIRVSHPSSNPSAHDSVQPAPLKEGLYETNKVVDNNPPQKLKTPQEILDSDRDFPAKDDDRVIERSDEEDTGDIDLILEGLEEKV